MLYFPSTNTAAHRPADHDVARLHALLDDDVWAFTNCRVEAPGHPVAEVDWFFYNTRTGSLMVSEWKRFPEPVSFAADTGKPWLLAHGSEVPNPIEQVAKQLDVVRLTLRRSVLPQHFAGFDAQQLRVAQSVYSPQIDSATVVDRIRFGKIYGRLEDLAAVVQTLSSPSPLTLHDDGGRLPLARALCSLFRCRLSSEVEAKLGRARTEAARPRAAVVKRISEIHREIGRLHTELADLTMALEPEEARRAIPLPASLSEHERMHAHLSASFAGVNGSKDKAAKALAQAWRAILADRSLHGPSGVSVSLFGSIAAPLIKDHHGSLQKLVGMQPRKWCVLQAEQMGLKPRDVPGKPSNIRVR